jgi:hypothetical protein
MDDTRINGSPARIEHMRLWHAFLVLPPYAKLINLAPLGHLIFCYILFWPLRVRTAEVRTIPIRVAVRFTRVKVTVHLWMLPIPSPTILGYFIICGQNSFHRSPYHFLCYYNASRFIPKRFSVSPIEISATYMHKPR